MAQTFLLLEDGTAISEHYIRYISWRMRITDEGRVLEVFAKVDEDYAPVIWKKQVGNMSIEEAEKLARTIIRKIVGRIGLILDVKPLAAEERAFKPFKPNVVEGASRET